MATDLKIALRIDAATDGLGEIKKLIAQIKELGGDTSDLEEKTEKLGSELDKTVKSIQKSADVAKKAADAQSELGKSTNDLADNIRRAVVGAGIIEGIKTAGELADSYRLIEARLKLVVQGQEAFSRAIRDVQSIALATFSDLEAVSTLYEKIASSTKDLGLAQSDVAGVTQSFASALKIGGATVQEASSAILQFSQALSSGRIAGEEFNGVAEASPYLLEQLAKGLGVPRGALKKLAEEGKLTTQVLIDALQRQSGEIEAAFKSLPQTVGNAYQNLLTQFQIHVASINEATGATSAFASGLQALGDNIEVLDSILLGVAAGGLAKLGTAIGTASAGASVATIAMNGLRTATAALSGPLGIGLAITAIAALVQYFSKAEKGVEDLRIASQKNIEQIGKLLPAQIEAAIAKQEEYIASLKSNKEETERATKALMDRRDALTKDVAAWDTVAGALDSVTDTEERLSDTIASITEKQAEQVSISQELSTATSDLTKMQEALGVAHQRSSADVEKLHETYISLEKKTKDVEDAAQARIATLTAAGEIVRSATEIEGLLTDQIASETEKRKSQIEVMTAQAAIAGEIAAQRVMESDATAKTLAALDAEYAALEKLLPGMQQQLDELRATATEKSAAAASAELHARKLETEAAALQGVVEGHKIAGESAVLTAGQLAQLRLAYESAKMRADELAVSQTEGKATQEQANQAQDQAVTLLSAYKTALEETTQRIEMQIAAAERQASIAASSFDVKLAQNDVLQKEAKLRGDVTLQTEAEAKAKEIEAAKVQASIAAAQQEIAMLQQQLDLKIQQATVDSEITVSEQASIQATRDKITETKNEIAISTAKVESLKLEAEATRETATAATEAAAAETAKGEAVKAAAEAAPIAVQSATYQISAYNDLTDATKNLYASQLQLLASIPDFSRQSSSISEYVLSLDAAVQREKAFASSVESLVSDLDRQGAESVLARRQLEVLAASADNFGDTMTSAGEQARQSLQNFREEAAAAVRELREFIAETNDDLIAQEQLQHEENLARIAELAATSSQAATLRDEAEAAEKARHQRELDRIAEEKSARSESLASARTEVAAVETAYTDLSAAASASTISGVKAADALATQLDALNSLKFTNVLNALGGIGYTLESLTAKAKELGEAL